MRASVPLIDTHTHLTDTSFAADMNDVLTRARDAGVESVVVVSETLDEARSALSLAAEHPMLRPAVGLFPTFLDREEAEAIAALAREHRDELVAIGEVGLDYWKVKEEADRAVQRDIFALFIRLATELELPLNVHSRSAGRHAIAFLQEHGATRVQLHAFDAKASTALQAVEAGWFFSIPPSIVRSPQKRKLVKRVPLEHLLLETDSPVLGPDRETRNEPANARVALEAIAEIKGLEADAVAEVIYENTVRLYGEGIAGS